ncbi:hypothetical protein [Halorubrum saccharovorum]|uniref:hypothetical protein n=1 Tax=Halorubrum saccharovorum TaxID=2248 RepID=UPI001EF9F50A|nr:hypothetical protein [Halorubrum saccharovorum]
MKRAEGAAGPELRRPAAIDLSCRQPTASGPLPSPRKTSPRAGEPSLRLLDPDSGSGDPSDSGESVTRLRESTDDPLDPAYVSTPRPLTVPTGDSVGVGDAVAYAHYYPPHNPDVTDPPHNPDVTDPPHNPDVTAPEGERRPLVVTVHGGPTSRSEVERQLSAPTRTLAAA